MIINTAKYFELKNSKSDAAVIQVIISYPSYTVNIYNSTLFIIV